MKFATGRKLSLAFLLVTTASLLFFTGCETIGFYSQAVSGQLSLLVSSTPIEEVIASPSAPERLKTRLKFISEVRRFAENELYLPTGSSYKSYVELSRPFVLWNVFATPEFSLKPVSWRYLFVGRMSYRGYFGQSDAQEFAKKLEQNGYDVFVGGVSAYSTLGWFDDPVTSAMLRRGDVRLASLIFHETAHRLLFIGGDTAFNEGFATAVATEGVRRWIAKNGAKMSFKDFLAYRKRHASFIDLVMSYRPQFEKLYESTLSDSEKIKRKEALFMEMKAGYIVLKKSWDGRGDFDKWFSEDLNNAKLASIASYQTYTPAFAKILESKNGDLKEFYRACEELGYMEKEGRTRRIESFLAKRQNDKNY